MVFPGDPDGGYPLYDSLPVEGGKRTARGLWNRDNVVDHLGGKLSIQAYPLPL